MLKDENSVLNIDVNNWAHSCDICRSAACTVYCRADSAYLCAGCDTRIHAANWVASRHERVWVCEVCERAPAAFLCKADSASLCAACDADIHSANPLARRHLRVPILPIPGGPLVEEGPKDDNVFKTIDEEDEDEAASWLLLNPVKNSNNGGFFSYGGEVVDEYLDLDYNTYNNDNQYTDQYSNQQQQYSSYHQRGYGGDSVVPVQNEIKNQIQLQHQNYQFSMEYETSITECSYPASISHSVSVSSMDVGVVPESISDVSISHPRTPKGTIDLFSSPPIQMPTQLSPMDREARVLRYREKKKTRKFEKTIRYASRKAYAETRPRIKGRFAKRTDVAVKVDQTFCTSIFVDGYGIVPSYK